MSSPLFSRLSFIWRIFKCLVLVVKAVRSVVLSSLCYHCSGLKLSTVGKSWLSEDVKVFPVFGDLVMETQWVLVSRVSSRAETRRQWVVTVIVCGRDELSPAQTQPANAISVSNTIVLFSRANAIMQSPVLRPIQCTHPRARHLDQLYALSLMWTKHTQSPRARCGPNQGVRSIVAFLWTGMNYHNSPVCMCVHTYVCVCVLVCVSMSHTLTMLHCPSDRSSNLCKDSFFSSISIHHFCCSPLFSLPFGFHSSILPSLSPPTLPVLWDCVHLLLFFSPCHSSTLLYLRLLLCLPFFPLPHCRRVLISISSTYTFLSLCCHPSVLCIRLTLSFFAFRFMPSPLLDLHQKL